LHPRQHDLGLGPLANKVISPGTNDLDLVLFRICCSQHQHGNIFGARISAQLLQHLKTIHPWHHQVGDDYLGDFPIDCLKRFQSVHSLGHFVELTLKNHLEHRTGVVVVLDKENLWFIERAGWGTAHLRCRYRTSAGSLILWQ
jgi:hypothetical protein